MRITCLIGWLALANCVFGKTDVLVYSATPAGIAAAISAAKGGASVTLVEPTGRIGGLMTAGLSYSDFRSFEALTGFFEEFARRVQKHYSDTYGPRSPQATGCWRGTIAEPKVNLLIFQQMLGEHDIQLFMQRRLIELKLGPKANGRHRMESVRFLTDRSIPHWMEAEVFIDASYEGDLMALAGENFHVGRESRDQYGESMAGDANGRADGQVQGYNYRFIMTQVETNKLMPRAPEGYDRKDFVGVLPHFESGRLKKVFASGRDGIFRAHLPLLPNGKTDVNDTPHAPVRLSMPDINDDYPTGDFVTRQKIIDQHTYYNVGLLYFLQNDSAVPDAMKKDARSWGWCRDEFAETGGIPPKLYIREARRLVGQHVFTGNDTKQTTGDARSALHTNSIAIGDYVHNCHGTGRIGSRYDGKHSGEFYKFIPPYQIEYGVIVPQKTANLLVPVACSASHFGFGALRLEPIWCSLGQAAGWAASMAANDQIAVQAINVPDLQRKLHEDKLATIYVNDVPTHSPDFAAVQWFGTRGGFRGLEPPGQPRAKSLGGQYCEAHPGHAIKLDTPLTDSLRARWQMLIPLRDSKSLKTRGDWILAAWHASNLRQ